MQRPFLAEYFAEALQVFAKFLFYFISLDMGRRLLKFHLSVSSFVSILLILRRPRDRCKEQGHFIHCESKKHLIQGVTLTMAIALSILDRFAKFFQCCKQH